MSPMSRNNSASSLMGFSVHQPSIGAPLQFFPVMGSKQLDEMINAYIPGDVSILDKRAAVSMEFFEYSMATGDLFKFFMVYPTLGSANTSPTMDSGYQSGFTTSPVMSETQWASSSSHMVTPSSSKKATSANDFSNLPGMKIMTKDGRDVTNSASRGCKTKEQRDHAHLMRIIKACDSCRRKKTKCDPSHKRPAAGASSGKITKKTSKNPRPAAAPPQIAAQQASTTFEFDQMLSESSSSLDSFFTESLSVPTDGFSMEWDQFIQYDEEPSEVIPYDYNFFLDPAGYFSPASLSSSSTSPSQLPITPIDRDVHITDDTTVGHDHKPILPYLNPGGLEPGDNYVDFNLYSPQSSCLDEELGLAKEVAASPIQSQSLDRHRRSRVGAPEDAGGNAAELQFVHNMLDSEPTASYSRDVIIDLGDGLLRDTSHSMHEWSGGSGLGQTTSQVVSDGLPHAILSSDRQATASHATVNAMSAGLSTIDNVLEGVTSDGLYGREAIYGQMSSRPLSDRGRLRSQSPLVQNSTTDTVAGLQERQLLLQGSLDHHSVDASAQSLSSQPCLDPSCGQDGPSSAKRAMTSSTTSTLATRTSDTGTQGDAFNNVHNIQSTKMPHIDMYRVPNANTPSPSPTPMRPTRQLSVTIPSSFYATSSPSHLSSSQACETEGSYQLVAVSLERSSVAGQGHGPVPKWNSGSESLQSTQSTGAVERLAAVHSQSGLSDTVPAASIIASLGVLSMVMSLSSGRTTTTKGNDPIEGTQSVASGNLGRCITTILLLSLSLSAASSLIPMLSANLLLIFGYIHIQRYTSPLDAKTQSSDSSQSHKLPFAKQLPFNSTNIFTASYTKALRLVQCDLSKKLRSWASSPVWSIAGCDALGALN
ncbi:hypothetical protein F4803DRAFT_356785 [Xylaria telfairii]|nr:hypothetical protein F4803DRAFT_356785 [Xylaria telfairii]